MTVFAERPRTRWAVPAAAAVIIGATTFVTTRTASADSGLPPRSAAQLLADVQQAQVAGLSGTVVQTVDLGLPELPGVTSGAAGRPGGGGGGTASLTSALSGTHTWRVWYAGPTRARLALVDRLGESDVVRNGQDLWVWSSRDKTAVHRTLPPHEPGSGTARPGSSSASPQTLPHDLATAAPKTPEEAARMALAAVDPTTQVTSSGSAVVAGRPAYELVLTPKDPATRVAQVRIAIDGEKHIPLRVQVYSTKLANPAVDVGFTTIDFATPDARQFVFTPPPGTTVTESGALADRKRQAMPPPAAAAPTAKPAAPGPTAKQAAPRVVGTGWSSVVVAVVPTQGAVPGQQKQLQGLLTAVPRVSGSWGSGRVVDGTLFSVVLTDDGRLAVGAVAPETLYAALAAR